MSDSPVPGLLNDYNIRDNDGCWSTPAAPRGNTAVYFSSSERVDDRGTKRSSVTYNGADDNGLPRHDGTRRERSNSRDVQRDWTSTEYAGRGVIDNSVERTCQPRRYDARSPVRTSTNSVTTRPHEFADAVHSVVVERKERADASAEMERQGVVPATRSLTHMMKPGKFDGTTSIDTFLIQFDTVSEYNGWSERDRCAQLKCCLTGTAGQIL